MASVRDVGLYPVEAHTMAPAYLAFLIQLFKKNQYYFEPTHPTRWRAALLQLFHYCTNEWQFLSSKRGRINYKSAPVEHFVRQGSKLISTNKI